MNNCFLYFNKFNEDIDYLTNCRNKCAHLKVDDNSLYVPKDYQVRMLICSMFDNILSVKAPFITDLFNIAQSEIERYSSSISSIRKFTDDIKNEITANYLKRMTDDSLKKSYKTFLKLLFLVDNEDCKRNIYGLYAFSYSLTDYLISNSKFSIFNEIVKDIISKIEIDKLKGNDIKQRILFQLVKKFPRFLDTIQDYDKLFKYITETIFLNPRDFKKYYNSFYARTEKTIFSYFKENTYLHITESTTDFYNAVCVSPDFSLIEFLLLMMEAVPDYLGFREADCFMDCLLDNLNNLTLEDLNKLKAIYCNNNQLYGRGRNKTDKEKINAYIDSLPVSTYVKQANAKW